MGSPRRIVQTPHKLRSSRPTPRIHSQTLFARSTGRKSRRRNRLLQSRPRRWFGRRFARRNAIARARITLATRSRKGQTRPRRSPRRMQALLHHQMSHRCRRARCGPNIRTAHRNFTNQMRRRCPRMASVLGFLQPATTHAQSRTARLLVSQSLLQSGGSPTKPSRSQDARSPFQVLPRAPGRIG